MRQHFHRCPNLRLVTIDAREVVASNGRGHAVLDELCAARGLAPCVGLVECEILAPSQKRELLAARVTRLREEEGGARSLLGDAPDSRAAELSELAALLRDERRAITEDNRRLLGEEAAAADWRGVQPAGASEGFSELGISPRLDESLRELRSARLDAIDRALEALEQGDRLACARCRGPIALPRLLRTPDSRVCDACASEARPLEGDQSTSQEMVAK
jgi:RNA polymerase-binding transcription factor DksA